MGQNVLWLIRLGSFASILLFSFIQLAVSAAHIAKIDSVGEDVPDYAGLALAIAIITLITIGPMLAIDFIRRGAVTSWIIVELPVTGVLMVLWLATAGTTADATLGITSNCGLFRGDYETICRTYQAIEAFAFINWLIFLFYFGGLLTFSIIAQVRRNPPWRGTVRDTNFLSKSHQSPVVAVPMQHQPAYTTATPQA